MPQHRLFTDWILYLVTPVITVLSVKSKVLWHEGSKSKTLHIPHISAKITQITQK